MENKWEQKKVMKFITIPYNQQLIKPSLHPTFSVLLNNNIYLDVCHNTEERLCH